MEIRFSSPHNGIDFLAKTTNSFENIKKIVEEICAQKDNLDGIAFDLSNLKLTSMQVEGKYQGVRVIFHALLHTAIIPLQLDIGFNDEIYEPQVIFYPTLLDLSSFEIQGYSFESVIAEKFEAIVKLAMVNTRMKDFFDIWNLSKQYEINGAKVLKALEITFNNRQTPIKELPESFKEAFYMNPVHQKRWKEFLKNIHFENQLDFASVISELITFLHPLVEAFVHKQPFSKIWIYNQKWLSRDFEKK